MKVKVLNKDGFTPNKAYYAEPFYNMRGFKLCDDLNRERILKRIDIIIIS